MKKKSQKPQYTRYQIPDTGFTLIELLVSISIIAILIGLSLFGLSGARESSRDAKRKGDLEQIRSGLEIFKSDCSKYPSGNGVAATVIPNSAGVLKGDDSSASCSSSNTYISQVPVDPVDPTRTYLYSSAGVTYELCTALEQGSEPAGTCGGSSSCGSATCNYKVTNP